MSHPASGCSKDDPKLEAMNHSISKSIMDSLNMEFNDGKPKFKLNEPTFSAVNTPYQNNLNCDDDDDETSFVVLGKSSMDFINLASLADYEEIKKKSLSVDLNSIVSTLSQEEIELKVAELLKENVKLKETLTRNNDAMKKQFNTLVNWQNELMKVHGNHKQKFAETCDMISLLKKENADLKIKLTATESMLTSQFSVPENSIAQKQEQVMDFKLMKTGSTEIINDDGSNSNPKDLNSKDLTYEVISLLQKENADLKMKLTDKKSIIVPSLLSEQADNLMCQKPGQLINNPSVKTASMETSDDGSISMKTSHFLSNDFDFKELTKDTEEISLLQKKKADINKQIADTGSMMMSLLLSEQAGNPVNEKQLNCPSMKAQSNSSNLITTNSTDFNFKELHKDNIKEIGKILEVRERQERDMHYLQEIILSLKEQLRVLNESAFTSLQLKTDSYEILEQSQDENRQQFFQHFTYYNERLSDLAKCYGEQTSHFISIQDSLKRCIDTIDLLLSYSDQMNLSTETIESFRETFENCRKHLINEQIQNISKRQTLIKAQNEFQKIFSDYNSTLHELEIIRGENSKPAEVKYNFEKEKEQIALNIKILEDEKNQLLLERKNCQAEHLILEQEKLSLNEEKASLNSQSMLYEAQMRTLQDDMKVLQKRHDEMLSECTKLKEELRLKNIELEGVKARVEISKDDSDTIAHLRHQLKLYESDFQEEQRTKQQLIQEREHLTDQLGKIRDHNQQLLQRLNGPNPTAIPAETPNGIPVDAFCDTCGLYKMPGQWHGPGWCQPID